MHACTQSVLLRAANAALLQNTSGNLATHIPEAVRLMRERLGEDDRAMRVVEHELKVLGLLGSSNGGYLS